MSTRHDRSRRGPPLVSGERNGALSAGASAPCGARRRHAWPLAQPFDDNGRTVALLQVRAADVDDVQALGLDPIVSDGQVDFDLAREWVARLADIPAASADQISCADILRFGEILDGLVGYAREAIVPGPFSVFAPLSKPLLLLDGRRVDAVRLRPPLFSDYAALGWPGWLERAARLAPGMVDVKTDYDLVAHWAARLSGLDLDALRKLPLADGRRVLGVVSALVCEFSVFVLASN